MCEIELRNVNFGSEQLQVAVTKRQNGSSKPRTMIAGITAQDLIDVVGAPQFYYGTEMEYARRVDTSTEVAQAIGGGSVELGVVSQIPEPLHENVGVLLNIPRDNGDQLAVLGRISSTLPNK